MPRGEVGGSSSRSWRTRLRVPVALRSRWTPATPPARARPASAAADTWTAGAASPKRSCSARRPGSPRTRTTSARRTSPTGPGWPSARRPRHRHRKPARSRVGGVTRPSEYGRPPGAPRASGYSSAPAGAPTRVPPYRRRDEDLEQRRRPAHRGRDRMDQGPRGARGVGEPDGRSPKSARQAAATALSGFHSATARSHPRSGAAPCGPVRRIASPPRAGSRATLHARPYGRGAAGVRASTESPARAEEHDEGEGQGGEDDPPGPVRRAAARDDRHRFRAAGRGARGRRREQCDGRRPLP